ncbi:hypothetical protein [Campylobacter sp. RM12637]|uniref:hypothetical protein n=1 Tax=Campylobacter sp. RM12637 TaxID=2735734 RepID=UPI003014D970|nr:hypothetical protein [Campylobacter sp. RM12637]
MIYVNYDENTREIKAYYDDEISDFIPEPNFTISEKEHSQALSINANYVTNELRLIYKERELSIDELKANKLAEIENAFKSVMTNLDKTPSEERLTFERQEREARAYQESKNELDAPFVKVLAEQRGVEFELLVSKIIEKADKYASISATFIGKRQRYEDLVALATTKEDLNSLHVEFSL